MRRPAGENKKPKLFGGTAWVQVLLVGLASRQQPKLLREASAANDVVVVNRVAAIQLRAVAFRGLDAAIVFAALRSSAAVGARIATATAVGQPGANRANPTASVAASVVTTAGVAATVVTSSRSIAAAASAAQPIDQAEVRNVEAHLPRRTAARFAAAGLTASQAAAEVIKNAGPGAGIAAVIRGLAATATTEIEAAEARQQTAAATSVTAGGSRGTIATATRGSNRMATTGIATGVATRIAATIAAQPRRLDAQIDMQMEATAAGSRRVAARSRAAAATAIQQSAQKTAMRLCLTTHRDADNERTQRQVKFH